LPEQACPSILRMPRSKRVREGAQLHSVADNLTLNKAFQLAHSIYRHKEEAREIALAIVAESLRGVEVKLLAQTEADRHTPQKPTKVRWSTLQWFQILIYCKSEAYEKRQEADNKTSLSEEDMIVRYIKHLILTTSRRNSFHITLGLSRLLYEYGAAETMAMYDLVFQDPDSSTKKSDAYYRARKKKLMEELAERFQRFVRIHRAARGEKRFQVQDDSSRFTNLVFEYLTRFTPWETDCGLPEHLDTWAAIHSLKSNQASQAHSLIHPSCFSRLTQALKLDPPETRIALPNFFLNKEEDGGATPPSDSSSSSELTKEEANEIREKGVEHAKRRKTFMPRSLSVMADGIERARLDLNQSTEIRFAIEEEVSLIELVGKSEEGELLLATHVIADDEDYRAKSPPKEYSIVLEGGQNISLKTLLLSSDTNGAFTFSLEISYRETKPLSAAIFWWRQLRHSLFAPGNLKGTRKISVLSSTTVIASLALIIVTGLLLYFAIRSRPGEYIAKQQPPPASVEPGKPPISEEPPQANAIVERTPPTVPGKSESPGPSESPKPGSATREPGARPVKSLLEVKRLYVGSLGDDAFSQTVRQKLIEKLQAGYGFVIVKSSDDADAAITGSVRNKGMGTDQNTGQQTEIGNVGLEFLNVSGDVIWRTRRHRGTADQIASQFAKDLIDAFETARRRRKS
jgi:hypothetical protein